MPFNKPCHLWKHAYQNFPHIFTSLQPQAPQKLQYARLELLSLFIRLRKHSK